MTEITDAQAGYIIENKDLPDEIINAGAKVAVVLTQDWCPQWFAMKPWLLKLEDELKVFYLCYNRKKYSAGIMKVKEDVFGNDLIPYVRYYRDGGLVHESNYVGRDAFRAFLND